MLSGLVDLVSQITHACELRLYPMLSKCRRLEFGAVKGVPSVGFGFLPASHDFGPSVIFMSFTLKQIVGQRGWTSSPDFLSSVPPG